MRITPALLFLLGFLFLVYSIAVIIMTDHPYVDYLKPSRYAIESKRLYSNRFGTYFIPAFFPKYMYLEKEEVDMAKVYETRNPTPTIVPIELRLTELQERFVPIDTLFLSALFFGLAGWTNYRVKRGR